MLYVLMGLLTLSCILYVYFYERITKKEIFIFKFVTSSILISLGLYIIIKEENPNNYDYFIIAGLFSGFLGDVFLGFKNLFPKHKHLFFVIGIGLFMTGHIAYINAMLILFDGNMIQLTLLVASFFAFTITFTKITNVKFGKNIFMCHVYSLLSSIFLSITTLNALRLEEGYSYILLFGVMSFVLSDFLLSYLYFASLSEKKRKLFKRISIITYYIGQIVLALSMGIL